MAVDNPSPFVSIASILARVLVMCETLHFRLKPSDFNWLWALGWTWTIIVNMTLYAFSINLIGQKFNAEKSTHTLN